MNILYVCSDSGIPVLGRKGASVHVRSMADAFTRQGHSVVLATPVLTKSPWEKPASLEASVWHVPADESVVATVEHVRTYNEALGATNTVPSEMRRILYNQQLSAKLVRRFRELPPDFVYERAALYSTAGVAVARAAGVPLVVELNAPLALEQATYRGSHLPELAAAAERATLHHATLVLTVSAALRDYVTDLGVARDRVVVVPNGVDPHRFFPAEDAAPIRANLRLGPGPVLGFVGGLRPWHGVRVFGPLLEALLPRYPHLRLVVVGEGPLRPALVEDFARRGVTDRVVFTGALEHEAVADVIRTFDVALAPYEPSEHLFYFSPLKLFEYMACGVPVVAASLGQIRDVIQHESNGMLYTPGDCGSLIEQCDRLLRDPAARSRIGQSAARTIHAQYTWEENARRVVTLVQQRSSRPEMVTA